MKITLLVIRCQDIESSKRFYEQLGLSFKKEKHGNSPTHFSCEHDGCVFELYPNKDQPPQDNSRLGFEVSNIEQVTNKFIDIDSYEYEGRVIYVLTDPDGREIEVTSRGQIS